MGRSSSGPDGCCSWLCCRAAETASFILWNEGSWGRCQHGCCGRGSLGPQGTGYLPTGKQQHFSQLRRLSQCVWDQPHPCPEDQAGYACNSWRGSHVVGVGGGDGPGEPHPASRKQPGDGQDGQFLSRETTKFRRFYEKISDFKTWEANSCFCFVLFCFVLFSRIPVGQMCVTGDWPHPLLGVTSTPSCMGLLFSHLLFKSG